MLRGLGRSGVIAQLLVNRVFINLIQLKSVLRPRLMPRVEDAMLRTQTFEATRLFATLITDDYTSKSIRAKHPPHRHRQTPSAPTAVKRLPLVWMLALDCALTP